MTKDITVENLRGKRMEKAIAVAAELFLKQGIESVKMTDIADETGVGVATLYRYFKTKTGVAVAAMTYLWNKLGEMFSGIFEADVFRRQNGLKQLSDLMRMILVLYTAHGDFMKLLGEFDLFLLQERIPPEELTEYENSVINFFPFFAASYQAGIADGSVREITDFQLFYVSYVHALMELTKKLLRGDLLASDDFAHGERELETMIDAAIYYLQRRD